MVVSSLQEVIQALELYGHVGNDWRLWYIQTCLWICESEEV